MREYTIINVDQGATWYLFRRDGQPPEAAWRFEDAWVGLPALFGDEPPSAHGTKQTGEEVSREWDTYCEHHEWNQDPRIPTTWKWEELPNENH